MNKNLYLGGLLLMAATLTACNGDYDDWASPQTNGPESSQTITLDGLAASAAAPIDLGTPGDSVKLFGLALPAGHTYGNTRIELTPGDGAMDATTVTLNTTEAGRIDSASVQSLVSTAYGLRPTARTFSGHVYTDVLINGQAFLADAGTITVTVTPSAPFISSAYYVVGGTLDWSGSAASKEQKFSHSGLDVYEDPVFSITIPAAQGADTWFAIGGEEACDAVGNGDWNQLLGTLKGNGNNGINVTEKLDTRANLKAKDPNLGDGSFCVPASYGATSIYIEINMLNQTYIIVPISKLNLYYMVGGIAGWNADAAATCLFYPEDDITASYTTKWPGAWDLKIWMGDDLGNWDNAWGTAVDGCGDASGTLVNSGAQSFQAPTQNEYYTLTFNTKSKAYTWTKLDNQSPTEYETIGLIGDFNGWGGDVTMTQVTPHNWYAKATFGSTGGVKFRANGGWDVNWGAEKGATPSSNSGTTYGAGAGNGDNISIEAGTYCVYLNDITGRFAFVAQ